MLAFSKECGISDSLIRKYLSGSLPGTENLVAIARAAGVNIAWLAAGEEPMRPEDEGAKTLGEDDIYAYIPLYDARCSTGGGRWNESVETLTHLAFTKYSLRKKGLQSQHICAIGVDGDSMEPLLHAGDTILIDIRHTVLEGAGIYVIVLDGYLYAKRLQRQFDGSVHIISENKAYKDMQVPKELLDSLQIVGRVVWVGSWLD